MSKKTDLDPRGQVSRDNGAKLAGLIVAICAASFLAWPLVTTLFRALMRHHYSVFGAVP